MSESNYLMESSEEFVRLDKKTNTAVVEKQARWAGLTSGMRVADLGCGSGKTTATLHQLAQPGGQTVGVDISKERIDYAVKNYGGEDLEFICLDVRDSLDTLGSFDFIWVRFLLEYYRVESFDLVRNIIKSLKLGGQLCLVDLDHNCLSHYGASPRLERTVSNLMKDLQNKANFDPYVGRKLYSFLYDLGFQDIRVDVAGHHVIYGELQDNDAFNWLKKVEIAPRKIGYQFDEYKGGYDEFLDEFKAYFNDPRRFVYSPIICCTGRSA